MTIVDGEGRESVGILSPVSPTLARLLRSCSFKVLERYSATEAVFDEVEIQRAQCLVVRSTLAIDRAALKRLPALRLIVRSGSGLDNLDLEAIRDHKVVLQRLGSSKSARSVAELAAAFTIALLRRIPVVSAGVADGLWLKEESLGGTLAGRTVAIWGAGEIGTAVGHLFGGLGAEVEYVRHHLDPGASRRRSLWACGIADIHILALPLTDETRKLISNDLLLAMRPRKPILVNLGRWDVVDFHAALSALDEGLIGGLAVDPVEKRNVAQDGSVLRWRDQSGLARNLILTPHIGAMTQEAQDALARQAYECIYKEFRTGPAIDA
jgi:D-3-phosphoglycerate dehydrogenase / 2-oxoglutarate reductase